LVDFDDGWDRVASAVGAPRRVDGRVVETIAAMLAHCRRQEDALGPLCVIETVSAQHALTRHLLTDCADRWRAPLLALDAAILAVVGSWHVDIGDHATAARCFTAGRIAAHEAKAKAYAAYVTASLSFLHYLRKDTPAALDSSAAARSLATGVTDLRVRAFAEQEAAGAFALDGQHGPCLAASERARELVRRADAAAESSMAYWFTAGVIDSRQVLHLQSLHRPHDAEAAARSAAQQLAGTRYVRSAAFAATRHADALLATGSLDEAAAQLATAASHADLAPRLAADVLAVRARMAPWRDASAVRQLDQQLGSYGLRPIRAGNAD
jgi:hypothetical protein